MSVLLFSFDPSLCSLVEKILANDSKKAPEKTSTDAAHLAALRKWALDTFVETIGSVDKKIDKDREFELLADAIWFFSLCKLLADAIWFFSLCVSKFGLSLREALNAFTSLNEVASSDRVGLKFSDRLLGIREGGGKNFSSTRFAEAVAKTYMKMAEKEKPSSTKGSAQWQTKKKKQQQQRIRYASTEDGDDEDEDEEAEGDASTRRDGGFQLRQGGLHGSFLLLHRDG
uniref:Uncharacterized protein n=1 Tax=Chromera velia CCMP2878 TaxID=1169474 RepID=A0A0G4G336_9ALVE|eukprot:Cvel_4123.t1-p1 / transcript=Cvel_4123.t1 / gene=Cvel_4123 / organism=Chromera_velia_CCMP2878 / gene_product=hypothetical protein / transcript_product=hypothetical protein / location=Cvel_scaffold176:47821-49007(+) / protein_length=228 / sequence_SO=supercontig / SO=protein_coding / is_pseudo=false